MSELISSPASEAFNRTEWKEITYDLYWYFRGALPPIYGPGATFAVSEPVNHDDDGRAVYTICKEVKSGDGLRYFAMLGTAYDMRLRNLPLTPLAQAEYNKLKQEIV